MKLKLSELNPNPFKKEINGGKLSKEQIESIKSNIKKLGLMGSIPVFKKEGKIYLIAGHHRVEALKQVYGKNFEIDVDVKDYSEDQVFRGMVIENLTQRSGEFREMESNIVAVRNYLNNKPEILKEVRNTKRGDSPRLKGTDTATANDISEWLDTNSEKVIHKDEILDLLNIHDKLNPELHKQVEKKHDKSSDERTEGINYTQAIILSRIEDKDEQIDLAEALKRTPEQRVREQGKLISQYKEATEDIKSKVREGEIDLTEVPVENLKSEIKAKIEEDKENNKGKIVITHFKQYQNEAGNKIGRTNKEILETCSYLNGLDKSGVLFELDWKTMLKIIESGTGYGKNYTKFMDKILEKIK